jgi:MtrB/PioB family decaheme-associated outer membrane protein
MKANTKGFTRRASVTAVRGALMAMTLVPGAYTANAVAQSANELTKPSSTVELGVGAVSEGSFKYGEYNGLEKKGAYGIGNVDLRGGAAYDSDSTQRWRIKGTDLGLETRNLSGEYGEQGRFRLNFGYDELLRNNSDTYQTPYLGTGSNNLTLPGNWIAPKVPQVSATGVNFRSLDPVAGTGSVYNAAGVLTAPTAAQLTTLGNIRAADLPAFQNVNLATKRTKYDGGFSYSFSPQWDFQASLRHEHKDGYKPMGVVSSQVSEFSATIPDLVNQDTDQANVSLNYKTAKGFMQAAYYGSLYKNNVQSMTWQDVNDLTKSATLATAPTNQFHQFSLTGGYNITSSTKLVANGSYARNTQNQAFLDPSTAANGQLAFGLPTTSLNGLVVSKGLNLKLTSKATKDLNFTAGYKFDDRDNRTPVNTYLFQDANEAKSGVSPFAGLNGLPAGLGSNTNIYNNRAYSKKVNQLNLQADYAVAKGQWLQGGYDWQKIDRTCNGAWIDCADAATTKENTLRAEWRANVIEDLSGRIGYAYSKRTVSNYNENAFLALVPAANMVPAGGATVSAYTYMLQNGLTGFGPLAGLPAVALTGNAAIFSPLNNILPQALYGSRNNINELPGMRRYMMADRNRDKLRSSVNWQANEQFSLQAGLDYNKDDYANSTYGLQDAKSWALNLDGTYAASDNFVANVFYTYEDQRSTSAGDAYGSNSAAVFQGQAADTVSQSCNANITTVAQKNANAKMDPCLNWSKVTRDKVNTIGLAFRQKNLMAGKLDLNGSLTYSQARTDIDVNGGSYVNNPLALAAPAAPALAAGVPAVFYISAAPLPTVHNDTVTFRLSGNYALDKASSVRVLYSYQHLKSTDYMYDGYQYGTGTNYLPTNQTAPSYTVNLIAVSYLHSF